MRPRRDNVLLSRQYTGLVRLGPEGEQVAGRAGVVSNPSGMRPWMRFPVRAGRAGRTGAPGLRGACGGDERLWLPASGPASLGFMKKPESDPAAKALDGLRRLEARVDALAEAVEVLARGLEGSPIAEPGSSTPAESARRAHELLLLAKSGRRDG